MNRSNRLESDVSDERKKLLNYSVISSQSTQFNFRSSVAEEKTDKDSFVKKEIGETKTVTDVDTVTIKEEVYEDNEEIIERVKSRTNSIYST